MEGFKLRFIQLESSIPSASSAFTELLLWQLKYATMGPMQDS